MGLMSRLDQQYEVYKANRWMRYFAIFCRVALALGLIPSGIVKVTGERFTALPSNHPLGHYFDALHLTGFYYTFIGLGQLTAALLLLIPRTTLLGAMVYFPIILNICVLTYATRFEGTRIATFMLLANLYLLCWDYRRLKPLLFVKTSSDGHSPPRQDLRGTFPFVFFGCVVAAIAAVIVVNIFIFDVRPGNSRLECTNACVGNGSPEACQQFCACIYDEGNTLDACLVDYRHPRASAP